MLRESSRTGKRLSCFLLRFWKKQSNKFLVAKIVPSFRIYFGIARLKLIITALATLKQVQGDENRAVIPNSFRNRKIEVDKPESCRRKRDFHTLATLNQVQGDNFCVIYGICAKINTNEHQNQIQHSPLRT